MNGLMFPEQRIENSKKTKKWRINCVDHVISSSMDTRQYDLKRMLDNYNMLNSQLTDSDYAYTCSTLGLSEHEGKKYVDSFNKVQNIYFSAKGIELARPFSYRVTNISPTTANEISRDANREFRDYIKNVIAKEIAMTEFKNYSKLALEGGDITISIYDRLLKRKIEELNKEFDEKTAIERILYSLKDRMTTKERLVNKLMKIVEKRLNIKWIKNETYGDYFATGKEVVEIRTDKKGELPYLKQLNPLNTFYHKSPDAPFINESDFAGYIEEMTFGDVLDKYGERLSKEDYEKIKLIGNRYGGSYGTSDKFFSTRNDRHASDWAMKRDAGIYPSGSALDQSSQVVIDGKYFGVPSTGRNTSYNGVYGSGLYSDDYDLTRGYCLVYTVYWRSFRKLIHYKYQDENGAIKEELVDDSFVIPDNAKKESYKDDMFAPSKIRYIWYENDLYRCAEEKWIDEVWKGTRINRDIYTEIEPYTEAYRSLLNPYKQSLPIYGMIYNSRNSAIACPADRIMPWRKLYLAVTARFLKIMSQDRGVWTFLNTFFIDGDIGLEGVIKMGEDLGIIPFNPYANSGQGEILNTMKTHEKLDLSLTASLTHYLELMKFIEEQIKEAAGISDMMTGQITPGATATEAQGATSYSRLMSEVNYYNHDLLWEKIMQGLMQTILSAVTENPNIIRGALDDEELAILSLEKFNMDDEFLLQMNNNGKAERLLKEIQAQSLSLIQNDKVKFSTFISMLESEDIGDLKKYVIEAEKEMEEREKAIQKLNQENQKELLDKEIESREDEQINKLDEIYLKGILDLKKEHVRGQYLVTSYNLQSDLDSSGESDLIENEIKFRSLLEQIENKRNTLDLKREELFQKTIQHNQDLQEKKEKRIQDAFDKKEDRKIKNKTKVNG